MHVSILALIKRIRRIKRYKAGTKKYCDFALLLYNSIIFDPIKRYNIISFNKIKKKVQN